MVGCPSPGTFTTWDGLSQAFINKYYPPSKTAKKRQEILDFKVKPYELLGDAWERFRELLAECPHHGIPSWLTTDTFYKSLPQRERDLVIGASGAQLGELTNTQLVKLIGDVAEMDSHYGRPNDGEEVLSLAQRETKLKLEELGLKLDALASAKKESEKASEQPKSSNVEIIKRPPQHQRNPPYDPYSQNAYAVHEPHSPPTQCNHNRPMSPPPPYQYNPPQYHPHYNYEQPPLVECDAWEDCAHGTQYTANAVDYHPNNPKYNYPPRYNTYNRPNKPFPQPYSYTAGSREYRDGRDSNYNNPPHRAPDDYKPSKGYQGYGQGSSERWGERGRYDERRYDKGYDRRYEDRYDERRGRYDD